MSNEERNIGGYLFKRYRADPDEHDWEARAEAAEAQAVGVCGGCGASWTINDLKDNGHRSCCPERKMLSAKEWHERAEAAEAERDVACEHSHELSVKYTVALNREREMREALRELVDLVDDQFVPDTFTLARARAALASQEEHRE
jgi:hypothetical protein